MIDFSYNLMCLMIDNFRGYTTQMGFIDNNVLSLGLNGTLEKYYPQIKTLILSEDRTKYLAGLYGLFMGLDDGGHTGLLTTLQTDFLTNPPLLTHYDSTTDKSSDLILKIHDNQSLQYYTGIGLNNYKKEVLGLDDSSYYYKFDNQSKTALIGFNTFETNYEGWDEYYRNISEDKTGVIPSGDSYAFVRGKLYQALDDNAKNVVIDLSTNGGGDETAVLGIMGLLNQGDASVSINDVVNHFNFTEVVKVDINLDGKYDEQDVSEANKFKDMNIVILTSRLSFSFANYLPSVLKELGYKTIGEKTGGGGCSIEIGSTPDGLFYVFSSCRCLTDNAGHNIDDGVEVDYNLLTSGDNKYSNFYNIDYLVSIINEILYVYSIFPSFISLLYLFLLKYAP